MGKPIPVGGEILGLGRLLCAVPTSGQWNPCDGLEDTGLPRGLVPDDDDPRDGDPLQAQVLADQLQVIEQSIREPPGQVVILESGPRRRLSRTSTAPCHYPASEGSQVEVSWRKE